MNKILKNISTTIFALTITLAGVSYADNVEIKLGSGDGFKVEDSNGSPLMDILSSNGYVGIGTNPNYKLDVSGDINFTGSLYQNGSVFSGSAWTTSGNDIYYDSGNVGIGTTSPGSPLEIFKNTGTSNVLNLRIASGGSGDANIRGQLGFDNWSGVMRLRDSQGTEDIRINAGGDSYFNSGNVGIGTTSPGYLLHLKSSEPTIYFQGSREYRSYVSSSNGSFVVARDETAGGATRMEIDSSGNVIINGSTVHNSDVRLKRDITTISDVLNKVEQMRGVSYYWKDTEKRSKRPQIGLIAQEVEAVFPDLVHTGTDGYKAVDYCKISVILIEAVKELKAEKDEEIVALKAENETLKNTLAALATEISDIKVALRQNNQFGTKLAKAGDLGNIGQ